MSNIKYINNEIQYFYIENPTLTMEIKNWGLRLTNLNLLCETKLHIFTWSLYPKVILYSTYNLIHVFNLPTFNCLSGSLLPRRRDEGLQPKIKKTNPWMREYEWCGTLGFLSRRPCLKKIRSLNDLSPIFNPLGIIREVFIGKSPKSLNFRRVLIKFAWKILAESAWPLKLTCSPLKCSKCLSGLVSRSKLMAQSRPLPHPLPRPRAMLLRQNMSRIERILKAENKDKFLEVFHLIVLLLQNKEIYNLTDSTT